MSIVFTHSCRGQGQISEENMARYLPRFEDDQHLVWFKEYVTQHTPLIKRVYASYVAEERGDKRAPAGLGQAASLTG